MPKNILVSCKCTQNKILSGADCWLGLYGKIIPAAYVDLWELLSAAAFGGLVSFWCILLLGVHMVSHL